MKSIASGYSKTMVSHCRGCIFQGFQFLEKVGKTTSQIEQKWHHNAFKSGSEGSPKRSLKLQWKIMKIWRKNVSKMRSKKGVVLMILGAFLRSGSKGVPGWSQGPSQGPPRVKKAPKWVSKSSKMGVKMIPSIMSGGFLKTLLKDTRTKHVSK